MKIGKRTMTNLRFADDIVTGVAQELTFRTTRLGELPGNMLCGCWRVPQATICGENLCAFPGSSLLAQRSQKNARSVAESKIRIATATSGLTKLKSKRRDENPSNNNNKSSSTSVTSVGDTRLT